ncbi:MAG: class I SAM-dependent methyltransferase [Candidatus Baldrarchaeia archaeon]
MEETFYHILAKERISEKDKKKLKKMYERLLREQELLKKVFSSVSLENKRILDIGTGQGFACKFLVDHAKDSEIVTVDKDPLSLNRVRNIVGDEIDKINFVKADLSNMSFLKDNYFDIVLSHYTLSTVDKNIFQKVLNEIYRVAGSWWPFYSY